MVWYSHLFHNFPLFIVIHTVKGFGTVNKAEIDVFLELSCFFDDPADVDNLISGSLCLFWNQLEHQGVHGSHIAEAWLGEFWALLCYHVKESESEVAQSCPTLCDPKDCSLPRSSVHGIFQARVLEWVAISFSRGSSQPRDQTWVSCTVGRFFTIWATKGVC